MFTSQWPKLSHMVSPLAARDSRMMSILASWPIVEKIKSHLSPWLSNIHKPVLPIYTFWVTCIHSFLKGAHLKASPCDHIWG